MLVYKPQNNKKDAYANMDCGILCHFFNHKQYMGGFTALDSTAYRPMGEHNFNCCIAGFCSSVLLFSACQCAQLKMATCSLYDGFELHYWRLFFNDTAK